MQNNSIGCCRELLGAVQLTAAWQERLWLLTALVEGLRSAPLPAKAPPVHLPALCNTEHRVPASPLPCSCSESLCPLPALQAAQKRKKPTQGFVNQQTSLPGQSQQSRCAQPLAIL